MNEILAKDVTVGQEYLTLMMKSKVKAVKKILREDNSVLSVLLENSSNLSRVIVSSTTRLLVPREEAVSEPELPRDPDPDAEPLPPVKMSSIINPMLLDGAYTPVDIAEAVIRRFPEKASEKNKLIQQIKGPRFYALTREAKKNKTRLPSFKEI